MKKLDSSEIGSRNEKIQKLLEFIDAHEELNGFMEKYDFLLEDLIKLQDSEDNEAIQTEIHRIFICFIVAESTPYQIKCIRDIMRDGFLTGCREAGIDLLLDTYESQQNEKFEPAGEANPMEKLAQLVEADSDLDVGLIDPLRLTYGCAGSFFRRCSDPRVDYRVIEILQRVFANLVVVRGHREQEYFDKIKKKFLQACRMAGINFAVPSSDYWPTSFKKF